MRQLIALTLFSVLSASVSAAGPRRPMRRTACSRGAICSRLQLANDPQIRPDGREIAYVRVSFDIMTDRGRQSIWLIDSESGEQTPLVTAAGSHSQPRWSPNGDRIAYVSTAEGGRPQLFVRWLQSGQTAKIADLTAAPGNLTWSPDGKWIAFTMFAPDEKARLGEAPPKPEGARVGAAARSDHRYRLSHRRRRLSQARLHTYICRVRRRRRAAATDVRRVQRSAVRSPGRRTASLCS